jgi:hypothetical protein
LTLFTHRIARISAAALAISAAAMSIVPLTHGSAATWSLGVFRGSGRSDLIPAYESWLGRPVTHVLDYVGGMPEGSTDPWAKIDDPSWWCNRWAQSRWTPVFSVAILPTWDQTLAEGAAGAYDAHWDSFGRTMVARGCGSAVLRLGWEFNGKFYPWAAGGKEAAFAAYWRRIVTVLRRVPGQAFRFDWSPLMGNTNADVEAAWPGDAYVDYVGLDAYDGAPSSYKDRPAERWNWQMTTRYGLAWHAAFAKAHGKPMTFPEWGVTLRYADDLGGGDNPYYIAKMAEWFAANPVAYAIYFEVDAKDAAHRLMTDQFPNASAKFLELFGGPD